MPVLWLVLIYILGLGTAGISFLQWAKLAIIHKNI
jgi:hypothetical protein